MGYSEAAMIGIKTNGRQWKGTIYGTSQIFEDIEKYIEEGNVEKINANLRTIAEKFKTFLTPEEFSQPKESLEWFEEESCEYEMENDLMDDWKENFDYHMNVLYDMADYNRIWVDPHK